MPELNDWAAGFQPACCESCDGRYLQPKSRELPLCPNCARAELTPCDPPNGIAPPELILPFAVSDETLARQLDDFAGGIWFAPTDLTAARLKHRLQPVLWPMWLVDSQVEALWQAETGFDYQAVSHRDQFDQKRGGWNSQEITETRTRWEPRVGRLNRQYHNIAAPALEEHASLLRRLGKFDLARSQPYRPQAAMVRLPNRSTTDAWPETAPAFQTSAAEECRQASQAQHIRDFRWTTRFQNQNWTLLLLPLYATYYVDDNRQPQPLLIHGQTGRISGPRRASMARARRAAFAVAATAAVIFGLSLLLGLASLAAPPLLLVAGLGLALAVLVGLLAVAPLVGVWLFNRNAAGPMKE